jgi:hypothetical protein
LALALEIKTARWPSKDPAGNPSSHSQDESRQLIVGRATDHGEFTKLGIDHRRKVKVYCERKATAVLRAEDVPS